MKVRDFRDKWFTQAPEARLARFKELADEYDKISANILKYVDQGLCEFSQAMSEISSTQRSYFMSNKGRELLALQSLCEWDCMARVETYQEDEWITQKFLGSWGETPTEAYAGVMNFLKGIRGVKVLEQEQSNSPISFQVLTRRHIYEYETHYHQTTEGYVVKLHCRGRNPRRPSDEEWLTYVGRASQFEPCF